jgi:hypothetical protein
MTFTEVCICLLVSGAFGLIACSSSGDAAAGNGVGGTGTGGSAGSGGTGTGGGAAGVGGPVTGSGGSVAGAGGSAVSGSGGLAAGAGGSAAAGSGGATMGGAAAGMGGTSEAGGCDCTTAPCTGAFCNAASNSCVPFAGSPPTCSISCIPHHIQRGEGTTYYWNSNGSCCHLSCEIGVDMPVPCSGQNSNWFQNLQQAQSCTFRAIGPGGVSECVDPVVVE